MHTPFPPTREHAPTLHIGIVVPRNAQALDVVGPVDAFTEANNTAGNRYRVSLIGTREGAIETASGMRLLPDLVIGGIHDPFDTLLVAGSPDFSGSIADPPLLEWLAAQAAHVRRIGSICNGAFVLAAAGLLKGRRATTHWKSAPHLARMYPDTRVDPDCLFVRDGTVYTSAGVTSGIDLCLALIEQDCGHAVSLTTARALLVFLRRAGGQSQFSGFLEAQTSSNAQIAESMEWAISHLDAELNVATLARQAAMSPRQYTRAFAAEYRCPPAHFIERLRVETARSLLETSAAPLKAVAHTCGFSSPGTMRRSFLRILQVAPADYRERFRAAVNDRGASAAA